MAGIDKIQNGLIFGALFGIVALAYALSAGSAISFFATWMNSIVTWLQSQSWMSWYTFGYLNYVVVALIGAIIGAYIDSR